MNSNFVGVKHKGASREPSQDGSAVERELIFESNENSLFRRFEGMGFHDGSMRFVAEAQLVQEKAAQAFFQNATF